MKENYKVYIHTFPNGKTYVGITQQEPACRWKYGAGYGKNQPLIYNAIQKYGWQNIYHQVLYDGLSKDEAEKIEIGLISILKSNNRDYGYNLANGGNCRGTLSEESRKKLSESRKGIIFSAEHIKNLSLSHKNYKPTDTQNHKNMMSNPRRKPVLCIETRVIYNSVREAGRLTGINYKRISDVCNNKYGRKSAGNFTWCFAENERS